MSMFYSAIKPFDIANGPGIRVSLFVSGCPHHCKGCFNQETWDYMFGNPFGPYEKNLIGNLLGGEGIAGFSVLGGEPLCPQNTYEVGDFIQKVKDRYPDKTIWVYTGYTIEELAKRSAPAYRDANLSISYGTMGVLYGADVLVDGRFVEEQKDLKLRFRGSSNQRIIDLRKCAFRQQPWDNIDVTTGIVLAEEYM